MSRKEWQQILKPYAQADHKKVIKQILNTVLPYIVLLIGSMYLANRGVSFLILLPAVVIAGGLMVRIFIFFHDCTHGSFTSSKKWNDILGNIFGFMVFTPYIQWKVEHSIHHSTVGNLDERGVGDIWTMTSSEYEAASKPTRFIYRLFRHPAFLFTIAPVFKFVVLNRIAKVRTNKKEFFNYMWLNVALAIYSVIMISIFSWQVFLLYQLTIMAIASSAGLWMFYIQHQFEDVYWESGDEWDLLEAALKGSTYYKLPAFLEWFTGYIGYHHIHHLNARIPNYNLRASYDENPSLQKTRTVTLFESFKLAALEIYDEKSKVLMTFKEYKRVRVLGN